MKDEIYSIYRRTEIMGCEMEDGTDTRKTISKLMLVAESEMDEFGEHQASDYGDQDYSYQVNYKFIAKMYPDELEELKDLIIKEKEVQK